MAQALPRLYAASQRIEDEQKLARILAGAGAAAPDAKAITRVTHGDRARLRGLPAVGRGTLGAIRGTDPARALLAKERQRRWQ